MTRLSLLLSLVAFVACASESDDPLDTAGDAQASSADAGGPDADALGCAAEIEHDTTDGSTAPVMSSWGSACTSDDECVALLGDGAVCLDQAVIYELPGGYCSKPCTLPDADTRFVPDDPGCDPNGGVACVGQKGLFEQCAPMCNDDAQCQRDGYTCRQMPAIASEDDPTICLMPDCCQDSCSSDA